MPPTTPGGSVRSRTAELTACADSAATCTRCDLYRGATQTVFGEGRAGAAVMLVGEQPGDREDVAGHPFVGPAGVLLSAALETAGIDRDDAYVTNAVKHFKFERRGKRRIHKKPGVAEVEACHVWLEDEIRLVEPRVVVCLGATAARAVLGRPVTIHRVRGQVLDGPGDVAAVVTIHPSAVLRARDDAERSALRQGLVHDLVVAAEVADGAG